VRDMASVAERLRLVRRARKKFLRLWAIDQALVEPLLERVAQDLAAVEAEAINSNPPHDPAQPADKS
jgi:hypothetical protein